MGDLLQSSSRWLAGMRRAHAAGLALYGRGGQTAQVPVTPGRSGYEVDDGTGLRVQGAVTDFLIDAADLADFGEPQAGDRITFNGTTYEVMPLGGEGHWRWSDPYRITMRIHSREIAGE